MTVMCHCERSAAIHVFGRAQIVILHSFIKKTEAPDQELALAQSRLKGVRNVR
jgi:phage-related protein